MSGRAVDEGVVTVTVELQLDVAEPLTAQIRNSYVVPCFSPVTVAVVAVPPLTLGVFWVVSHVEVPDSLH